MKYREFLEKHIGLSIIYGFENGVCLIYASNHPMISALIFSGSFTRAEIVKIEDDFIFLGVNGRVLATISLNIVVFNLIPSSN